MIIFREMPQLVMTLPVTARMTKGGVGANIASTVLRLETEGRLRLRPNDDKHQPRLRLVFQVLLVLSLILLVVSFIFSSSIPAAVTANPMSRAEQIRGKLFGSGDKPPINDADGQPISRSASDVPLTIHIPKPTPNQPVGPPKTKQEKSDSSPKPAGESQQRDEKCFRERLVQQLGDEYHGAERHRLVQDAKKQLHWKRWGPYLSDRQWVSLCLVLFIDVENVHRESVRSHSSSGT